MIENILHIPDPSPAGYIKLQERAHRVLEVSGQVSIRVTTDGDTGYRSPLNVRHTVAGFVQVGVAGVMVEDETGPNQCSRNRGKSAVSGVEAVD